MNAGRLFLALLLFGSHLAAHEFPAEVHAAAEQVDPRAIEAHVRFLADDLLEGRDTGSRGYDIAARYVATQLLAAGAEPAGDDGWFQHVPLRSSTFENASMSYRQTGEKEWTDLELEDDFVVMPNPERETAKISAPLTFVGFGVTAPELGWDDYSGIDAAGRIVVAIRNAPSSFPGTRRAHHASTRQKLRNAAAHGAVGLIEITTQTEEDRTPWSRLVGYAKHPTMRWLQPDGSIHDSLGDLAVHGRLHRDTARTIFRLADRELDQILEAAEKAEPLESFHFPVEMALRSSGSHETLSSPNVVGVIRGSDPELRNESLVLVAHLDHVGIREDEEGDSLYNGAYDNATGIAIMLEIARAFGRLDTAPARSIIFLAVTAEEKGLLGADYFANHPTEAAGEVISAVSLDMFLMLYPLRDIVAYGAEHSSLGADVEKAAAAMGVAISPDWAPEESFFVRTDHYPFVRRGIPALYLDHGLDSGDPSIDGKALVDEWMKEHYHKPSDDLSQPFDWTAGADFARLSFLLSWEIARDPVRPVWNEGDFFGETFGSGR